MIKWDILKLTVKLKDRNHLLTIKHHQITATETCSLCAKCSHHASNCFTKADIDIRRSQCQLEARVRRERDPLANLSWKISTKTYGPNDLAPEAVAPFTLR